ncbi:MAG: AAA family ATPase [Gammaproteobacteria bacterium]
MVENDIFSVKDNNIANGKDDSTVHSLITLERSQKLDLLSHLITNLRQSLIVCGPSGIGKSTLLNVLIERSSPDWHCFYIQGSQQLSFESLLDQLSQWTKQERSELNTQDLTGYLAKLSAKNQKLVLIVDNSGLLVPGLIDALNRFSLGNPALRIIFALTQDELYVKSSSDNTVDDCHFIEIPTLSEKQCGEFLRNLSGKPGAAIAFSAIDDAMIAYLYQETHGIPGRIIAALPHLPEYGHARAAKWLVPVLLISVAIAGLFYWALEEDGSGQLEQDKSLLYESPSIEQVELDPAKTQHDNEPEIDAATLQNDVEEVGIKAGAQESSSKTDAAPEISSKQVNEKVGTKPESDTDVFALQDTSVVPEENESEKAERETSLSVPQQKGNGEPVPAQSNEQKVETALSDSSEPLTEQNKSVEADKKIEPESNKPVIEADDRQWLYQQSPKNYTLQLIALSKYQSLVKLMSKHSTLQPQLKFIKTVSNHKEKYILLYGSFANYAAAGHAMQQLPKEFRKSWIRRFKILQNDIKNAE